MESDSFVIISSPNNSYVAFFPLITHCVLIYVWISMSLTQNCQVRVVLLSTADCEQLFLSPFLYSSVPHAEGLLPGSLCFSVFDSPWMSCSGAGSRVNRNYPGSPPFAPGSHLHSLISPLLLLKCYTEVVMFTAVRSGGRRLCTAHALVTDSCC